jgi:hypothetical protein
MTQSTRGSRPSRSARHTSVTWIDFECGIIFATNGPQQCFSEQETEIWLAQRRKVCYPQRTEVGGKCAEGVRKAKTKLNGLVLRKASYSLVDHYSEYTGVMINISRSGKPTSCDLRSSIPKCSLLSPVIISIHGLTLAFAVGLAAFLLLARQHSTSQRDLPISLRIESYLPCFILVQCAESRLNSSTSSFAFSSESSGCKVGNLSTM